MLKISFVANAVGVQYVLLTRFVSRSIRVALVHARSIARHRKGWVQSHQLANVSRFSNGCFLPRNGNMSEEGELC